MVRFNRAMGMVCMYVRTYVTHRAVGSTIVAFIIAFGELCVLRQVTELTIWLLYLLHLHRVPDDK